MQGFVLALAAITSCAFKADLCGTIATIANVAWDATI
jgi:hypothetical protein